MSGGADAHLPRERIVRPVTLSGEVLSLIPSPGIPLMGDTFGGLLAGVEPAPNTCRATYGEVEQCYNALARFAGPSGSATWRYDSPGALDRPAQGPDGTIYFIEHVGLGKSVVILNGATGAVTARVPLANFVTQQTGCQNTYNENEPSTAGPIVGGDGFGYLAVSNRVRQINYSTCSSYTEVMDVGMSVLRLSSAGQVSVTVIDQRHCTTECDEPKPKQLLPDGMDGLIAIAEYRYAPLFNAEWKMTRIDAEGAQSNTAVAEGLRIELIGPGGTAYLNSKQVLDLQTGLPIWSLPSDWNWVAAANNGDGFAERNGEVARFGPAGQLGDARQLNLINPSQAFGGWAGIQGVGNTTTGGLTAYAMPFDYGTRWDETYRQWGFGVEERRGYGDQSFRNLPQLVFHTNYNAIEIETSFSADQIFDAYVRTFAGVDAGPYASVTIEGNTVSAVGQRVTFTMKSPFIRFFQDPFQVEAVRYVPSQRTLAVTTINPVHPIFGWRYWRVFPSANGITIETGAYDRPASGLMFYSGYFVRKEDQTGIWREYMRHILNDIPGAVLRSPLQLMEGVWDVDSNPASAAIAPNATRQNILTQVCGVAPTNIPVFELTRSCQ